MSNRYVCIHGHFYQPPRENPWLESIELQDSAYPYHDWNERITAECYAPNANARILDDQGRITRLVNNYSRISFDFGPTLLAWLELAAPDVYQAVLDADAESVERFSGHGGALAQAYGHMILPLANDRDVETQVRWGLADFEHRFGRPAEGMWLPETAVDTRSLEALARHGVRFTILSPGQARRIRKKNGRAWHDVEGGRIDPAMPYEVRLPSGRKIAVFFYDGPASQAVAFEGLLTSGEEFADRLVGLLSEGERPQLAHIATDGETYGHHHHHGELALGYALERLEDNDAATLTNYGEHLERCPPTHVVEIIENTSWSCAHGVERWRSDCGCNTGRGWQQAWRAPLRESLDWLRDRLAPEYERAAGELLEDPWAARDDYVEVMVDRSIEHVDDWLDRHAHASALPLTDEQRSRALELLELQRHMMLTYTSCGWFFDEISGIETVQVLQYAERVLQLASESLGIDLETEFLELLAEAPSNLPALGDGRRVHEGMARPAIVDLIKLAVHYGASSLFDDYSEKERVYCHDVERHEYRLMEAGRARLAVGQVKLTSVVTRVSGLVSFGVLHLGDHNLTAGARASLGLDAYRAIVDDTSEAFARADFPEVIRRLDSHFGSSPYSLRTLFRDEQRKVLDQILEHNLAEAEVSYRHLYEQNAPLMRFLADIHTPLPRPFRATAEMMMNSQLGSEFASEELDVDNVRALFDETAAWALDLDVEGLSFALAGTIERMATALLEEPEQPELLDRMATVVELAQSLPWSLDLWRTQNIVYEVVHQNHAPLVARSSSGDADATELVKRIRAVGGLLSVATPEMS